ncbi:MAG: type II secretion system F family protein [Candidatus Omnitrophica bacterium]|nr:type II secretion system F family protein [Candidatus Omnitrophota bacterium]
MYYKFSVLSETGNEINGIEQGSYSEIKNSLRQKNYYILSLEADFFKSIRFALEKKTIKAQTLAVFFEDLVNMLKTGIAMNEAVSALRESSVEPVLTKALSGIEYDLVNGFSLTNAFKETKVFPWLVLNMLKVGEKSGSLEQVFEDLAKYYSREAEFLSSLKSAVIYPIIVFCMLVGIMFYVSFKVLPHLEALLPIRGNAYFSTRLLLSLSHFLKDFWFVCLLFPVVLACIYSRFKKSSVERIASFYYKLPLVGSVAKDAAISNLFSKLAVLQRNGINIADALSLIEETTSYQFLAKKIQKLNDLIVSGLSFWQALQKDPFFPKLVYTTVRKGEEMGSLDEYLQSLSKYYFDKVSRSIRVILGFIQPALLVFCAAVLLFVVSAFIMPVYSNLSNIAGGNVKF